MPLATLKFRRGTAADWAAENPILSAGEPGYETDTGGFKIGDGVKTWNSLAYSSSAGGSNVGLTNHIESETPHPVYDDGPSLVLLYENAKV